MSLFSKIAKGVANAAANFIPGGSIVKGIVKVAVPALSSSFKKPAAKAVLGAGAAGIAGGMGLARVTTGGNTMNLPVGTLPALPSLASAQTGAIQQQGAGGLPIPWWKGPGGKLQLPWNDPRIPEYLKQFALDDAYLKTYYRAPRGYVIIKDASGRPFAVNKAIAKSFGLWKPAAKPPISATDWKHYKRNQVIEKRLRKIAAPALRKSRKGTAAPVSRKRK